MDLPLKSSGNIYLKQKLTHKFTLKEYDEINGDELLYVVHEKGVGVLNPDMVSTGILYSEFVEEETIKNIDAVTLEKHEVLFIHTKK